MEIKSKIIISILAVFVIYGGYYFGIPAVLNRAENINLLKDYIKKEYGFNTQITNPKIKMGYLPSIWIMADEFSILNNDNSKALEIKDINTKIKLIPLIFCKAEIDHFKAGGFNVNLIFDKQSKLKLGQYPIIELSQSKLNISKAVLNIDNYNITLKDEVVGKNIILNGKDFILHDFTNNKRIKLSTNNTLHINNKTSKIKADIDIKLPLKKISNDKIYINGQVENLDLTNFSPYAQYLSHDKIQKLSGVINLNTSTYTGIDDKKQLKSHVNIKNLGIMQKDLPASIYCKNDIDLNTTLNFIQNGIEFEELTIKSKGIDALISGKIEKINSKSPTTDLKVSINKSKIEDILPLIPGEENLVPEFNLYLLKKYKYYGDIIGNLEIKGSLPEPSIYGNILSNNGYLVKPIPNNTPKATIKLEFKGDKTYLDAIVPASQTQTVYVKGDIKLYKDKSADLTIKSTQNVDLGIAEEVLNPLHEILKFDLGPVPIMDIKGKGNIVLHVVGNKKDPHAWGVFNFTETTASFNDIHNMTLKNGRGYLKFDDQSTHFKTETATLNGKPVSVDGTCTLLGVLDFKVSGLNQSTQDLLKIIKTSPMMKDIQNLIYPIETADGKMNLKLNLTGQVKDVYDVVFNKNIFANGELELIDNSISIKDLPVKLKKLSGNVNFKNLDANFNISSNLSNSKIRTYGKIKDLILDANVISDKFTLSDAVLMAFSDQKKIPFLKDLSTISTSFTAQYKGPIDKINYDALSVKGRIYPNRGSKSILITDGGNFNLDNSHLKISPIKGTFNGNSYILTANVSNILTPKQDVNGYFSMSNIHLANLEHLIKTIDISTKDFKPQDISDMRGVLDLSARIRHNDLSLFTKLDNTEFVYVPKRTKIRFNSGNVLVRNNTLSLNKINAFFGEMPIFLDGKVYDFYKNPDLNLYVNAKPTQEFFDEFFNNKAVYPIKIKGDVILSSKINGTRDKIASKTEVKIAEASNIYYMGATLGDAVNPVKLYLDNIYTPKYLKINDFKYDKIIASQNNKNFVNTQLISNGTMEFLPNNNVAFKNFRVKTENPTDAKIFNIIFRKPFMKQGIFTSDLIINGTSLRPRILGNFEITSIDIPFFDSTINDVSMNFKPDKINIESKGIVLTNKINVSAIVKNDLVPPYKIEKIKVKLNDLNINKITNAIKEYESDLYRNKQSQNPTEAIDPSQIIIKNAEIAADTIKVRNISAEDFTTNLSFDENKLLNVKNFEFKLAEGVVDGSLKYNLNNNKIHTNVNMKNSNAQIMAEALFNIHNQIYGSVTGNVNLDCDATSQQTCTDTLAGSGYFIVADGKMPKLGSLEYLLKAGNLLKGGVTGLSINSIIDLITPLKTGEFDSISGNLNIQNGIAQNIDIYSSGKDLNIYINGTYNLSNAMADMNIYGTLSNNITNVFGKVKSASLNTLLNTIPWINKNELDPETMAEINKIPNYGTQNIYRIFNAEIFGDINGNNYVRSFKWIK